MALALLASSPSALLPWQGGGWNWKGYTCYWAPEGTLQFELTVLQS